MIDSVLPVGLALLVGATIVRFGPWWSLAGIFILGAAIGLFWPRAHRVSAVEVDDPKRAARLVYYAGVSTMGLLSLRVGQFTVSDYLFLGALALTMTSRAVHRTPSTTEPMSVRLPPLVIVGVALWVVGSLISTFDGQAPLEALAVIVRLVYLTTIWFWLGGTLLTTPGQVRLAICCWVTTAAISGAAAIAQFLWGNVIPGTIVTEGSRMMGFTQHPNDLGGLTGIAMAPALLVASHPVRRPWQRSLLLIPLVLVTAGLLLSGSIAGLTTAVASGLVWLLTGRARLKDVLILATVVVISLLVGRAQLDAQTQFDRFGQVTDFDTGYDSTLYARVATDRAALDVIAAHPLIGVGLEAEVGKDTIGMDVHNLLLGAWFRSGLLGLLGILLLWVAGASSVLRVLGTVSAPEERSAAAALAASLVGFVVMSMSHPGLYQRHGWITVALGIALAAQRRPTPDNAPR